MELRGEDHIFSNTHLTLKQMLPSKFDEVIYLNVLGEDVACFEYKRAKSVWETACTKY